ncbi:MAG: 50S ribosomal protein L28 [Chloroflexi bacterium]|jgi:large subunit ribosomal protein L28|nr:50S ribosomal protein L28 [Chloroflexota bacterium]
MAKCEYCGKHTQFGQNNPFSQKKTKRTFKANLQKVRVIENGQVVPRTLCAKCIKTLGKPPRVRKKKSGAEQQEV